ncbi:hypothetical protein J6A34_03110 [bacterium]|nr:hypothetical protein [bacterium]
MKYCSNCKNTASDESNFCSICGNKLQTLNTVEFGFEYERDEQNRIIKSSKYKLSPNGNKITCWEIIREYHEDGLLHFIGINYFNEDGKKIKYKQRHFFHVVVLQEEHEEYYNPENGEVIRSLRITHTFDENKNKVLVNKEEYSVTYTPNLKETTKYIAHANNPEKKRQGVNEYIYDENKQLINIFGWLINDEGQKILNIKNVYEYIDGQRFKKYSYQYNNNGELVEENIYKYTSKKEEPDLYKQKTYKYDNNGILLNIDTKDFTNNIVETKPTTQKVTNSETIIKTKKIKFYQKLLIFSTTIGSIIATTHLPLCIICAIWLILINKWNILIGVILNNLVLAPLILSLLFFIPNEIFNQANKIIGQRKSKGIAFTLSLLASILFSGIIGLYGIGCISSAFQVANKDSSNLLLYLLLSFVCAITPLLIIIPRYENNPKLFLVRAAYKDLFAISYIMMIVANIFFIPLTTNNQEASTIFFALVSGFIALILTLCLSVIIPIIIQWGIINEKE